MKQSKFMKKATSLILAAVMMTSSVFPVYATDAEMVPETVDEATISTEAILETEQETDAKENATEVSEASEGMDEKEAESETKEEYNPYIILLPSDGFSYDVDSEHVSDEYSTSEYKILLYEEGEHVKFSVNSDKNFSLMDAVNNSVYKERSENYDFSMPAVDLAIVEEAEATKENVQKEEQIEETSSETEALEVSDPELEDFLTEDFSEESTEAVTEAITEVKQDVTEATEVSEASEAETVAEEDAQETEELASFSYNPANGDVIKVAPIVIDTKSDNIDIKAFKFYDEKTVNTTFVSGEVGTDPKETYEVTYKCSYVEDPSCEWTLIVPFNVLDSGDYEGYNEEENKEDIIPNDSFPIELKNTEGFDGVIPEKPGDKVVGPTYKVALGDEDFDLEQLTLGYDPILFNRKISNLNGFDVNKEGTYKVVFNVTSLAFASYYWEVETTIVVEKETEGDSENLVRIKDGDIRAVVTAKDGTVTTIDYGMEFRSESAIEEIHMFSSVAEIPFVPEVKVVKNGEETNISDLVKIISDTESVLTLPEMETGYVLTISFPALKDSTRKSTRGWLGDEYSDHIVSIDGYTVQFDETMGNLQADLSKDDLKSLCEQYGADLDEFGDSSVLIGEFDADIDPTNAGSDIIADVKEHFTGAGTFKGTSDAGNLDGSVGYNTGYVTISNSKKDAIISWVDGILDKNFPGLSSGLTRADIPKIYVHCSDPNHDRKGPPNHSGWKITARLYLQENRWMRLKLYTSKQYATGYQLLEGTKWVPSYKPDYPYGSIELTKVQSDLNVVNGGDVSLSTQFTLYTDKACTQKVETQGAVKTSPTITFENLEVGTYYIKETAVSPGSASNTGTVYSAVVEDGKTTKTLSVVSGDKNSLKNGNQIVNQPTILTPGITVLTKTAADTNGPLKDAIFKVTYRNKFNTWKADWYMKTDAQGKIVLDQAHLLSSWNGKTSSPLLLTDDGKATVPEGYLVFTEVDAPDGYVISGGEQTVKLVSTETRTFNYTALKFTNTPAECKIEIQKYVDPAKKIKNPISNQYSFAGAVYEVYDACKKDASGKITGTAGDLITKISVNANGYGRSEAIPLVDASAVKFYVKEVKAPTCGAYKIDPTIYEVSIKAGETKRVDSYEEPVAGKISVKKLLQGLEGDEIKFAMEKGYFKGITFNLVHENAESLEKIGYATITLGANTDKGVSDKALVCGKWTITEAEATTPVGYKVIEPMVINITPDTLSAEKPYELEVEDEVKVAYVKIVKKDKASENTITFDEAQFKIVDDFGRDVSVKVKGDDKETIIFSTTNGEVSFGNPFNGGKYTLVEVKAPIGYALSSPIEFSVDIDSPNGETIVEVPCLDAPKLGKLSVTKIDKETGNHCGAGFKFNVIAKEDCVDGSGAVRPGYEAGSVVDTITTDENGVATSKDLYLGKYEVQEVEVNEDGYSINHERYRFELKDNETNEPIVVEMNVANKPFEVKIKKIDTESEISLEGIVFRLKEKGTEDNEDQLFTTDKNGEISIKRLSKSKTYEIKEVQTIPGYNLCEDVVEFTTDENGLVDGKDCFEVTFGNKPNVVEVSKTDITTGEELPGAKMTITDESGKVFDEWVSEEKPHKIYPMPAGKYTLTEVTAPEGYEVEESIEFEIIDSLVVQKVEMKDSPYREVVVSKKDITNDQELPGATLVIKDAANNVVDEWVSEAEPHHVKLHSGIYTLSETIPADGYVTANTITFEVIKTTADDYDIKAVEMKDDITKTTISKKDITTGDELPGAKLEIRDKDGNVVESWISTDEIHYIEKLPIGKYTLTEITAPDGYEVAETIEFEVKDTPEIQHYEMFDSPNRDVEISKKDITNSEELPGAVLKVTDLEGNTVEEWTSTEEAHKISLPSGKYVLTETKPADGYITAESIDFEVLRRDKEGDFEIQHVEMFDDITKIQISKQDITNKKELPGAKLAIKDSEGKDAVEPWVSTNEPHYIEKLPVGEYTLVEITAPNGYEVAENVKFTVEDTDIIQHVTMFDAPTPSPENPVPKTGDDLNVPVAAATLIIIMILFAGGFVLIKKKKKIF